MSLTYSHFVPSFSFITCDCKFVPCFSQAIVCQLTDIHDAISKDDLQLHFIQKLLCFLDKQISLCVCFVSVSVHGGVSTIGSCYFGLTMVTSSWNIQSTYRCCFLLFFLVSLDCFSLCVVRYMVGSMLENSSIRLLPITKWLMRWLREKHCPKYVTHLPYTLKWGSHLPSEEH